MPLAEKVRRTETLIREWVDEYGLDGVYVSFSGGKDSTVLLDIARNLYPEIPAVFIDTGLEYPEIREFVRSYDNVDWLKPKMTFPQVIKKYGYPFISKEVSECVKGARVYLKDGTKYKYFYDKLTATGRYAHSKYNQKKWEFLLDAPFDIANTCCRVMKKNPAHSYARKTGRKPITGQQASESVLRLQKWLQYGCNGFDMKEPVSNPMSFWNDQDVLRYTHKNKLKLASVYGEIHEQNGTFYTTGCKRTGCMFCGFGCHIETAENSRFRKLKETHPAAYDYMMREPTKTTFIDPASGKAVPVTIQGLGYKNIIDWINEHGGTEILY